MEPGSATERDTRMLELRRLGRPLGAIADEVGLSRQGVQQRLRALGGPTAEEAREAKLRHRAAVVEALAGRIRDDVKVHPGTTVDAMAERLGVPRSKVWKALPPELRATVTRPQVRVRRWSDEQILASIRVAATFEYPLTTTKYDELILIGEVDGPKAVRVFQRFGTWTAACTAAGVEPPPAPRTDYQSRWTNDELEDFVRQYLTQTTTAGSLQGYDAWRRDKGIDAPSGTLVRLRFGRWNVAKQRALNQKTSPSTSLNEVQGEPHDH